MECPSIALTVNKESGRWWGTPKDPLDSRMVEVSPPEGSVLMGRKGPRSGSHPAFPSLGAGIVPSSQLQSQAGNEARLSA